MRVALQVLSLLALGTVLVLGPMARADEDREERRARLEKARTEFDAAEKAFVERVNAAIDRGRDWLLKQQRSPQPSTRLRRDRMCRRSRWSRRR